MKNLSRDALPVVIATALASVMILVTGNGVADAVNDTEVSLPPPGPFSLGDSKATQIITASDRGNTPEGAMLAVAPRVPTAVSNHGVQGSRGLSPVLPAVPNKPKLAKDAPQIGVVSPVKAKSLNKGAFQEMKTTQAAEPVLEKAMPSISQSLKKVVAPTSSTKKLLVPSAPKVETIPLAGVPVLVNAQQVIKKPATPISPKFSTRAVSSVVPMFQVVMPRQPMPPHQPLSQNYQKVPVGVVAPQIQQYRYVPLPVIQSNYQQRPSYDGSFPATGYYWVPQK